ncbi:MAG: hydroxymethylglutaryl-CoA reductase (NADPH) [Candidatus Methanomethylophilaceae archaeon]|nr:hydroxymethylglutaryl-CoA reductase (NADPH) [Candidatus Methanomethylophilaceae archaeon]MDD3378562.1 hydroxymethylglutaryl-CoA reductase (NADPH) [Candidatus Methanomethylophilaceae archaeon]MDY0224460.1 hydroxymethylglutaryl-CoA reductase (NADPH) [Candidatus Methanomethylophilaceae archaeon]
MSEKKGLKNRGYSHADVDERREAVEKFSNTHLENISKYCFDSEKASKNIENMIGSTQIPLGFAGPITISGDYAQGDFIIPLATTEGALVASISRGMSVINASGGVRSKVFRDFMTRAPVFRVRDIAHSSEVIDWIHNNFELLAQTTKTTTTHGKLYSLEAYPNGRSLFLRLQYETGDAMGMNMATIATEAVSRVIEKETGAVMVSVSGNMCSDKKPAAINMIQGRGKTVVAEALIPKDIVIEKLHTDTETVVETNYRKNLVGSTMAVTFGANAHAANMVAALYIATGQDPAQVVGGSMTITTCENVDGDLYICVRMPSVEVGTVGGGTRLPCQSEALTIMGCLGDGGARKFSELVAATVLAGELSTLAAQAAGQLGKAHQELGR